MEKAKGWSMTGKDNKNKGKNKGKNLKKRKGKKDGEYREEGERVHANSRGKIKCTE